MYRQNIKLRTSYEELGPDVTDRGALEVVLLSGVYLSNEYTRRMLFKSPFPILPFVAMFTASRRERKFKYFIFFPSKSK